MEKEPEAGPVMTASDLSAALGAVRARIEQLSPRVRSRLSDAERDDASFELSRLSDLDKKLYTAWMHQKGIEETEKRNHIRCPKCGSTEGPFFGSRTSFVGKP